MRTTIVLSMIGKDRIGIVDDITQLVLNRGGNIETSRMARLGGEFAILMLVSLPAADVDRLNRETAALIAQGYTITTTRAEPASTPSHSSWLPFRIEVRGADHEGIIHGIAHFLSERGINIESLDTNTTPAPVSGTPLFSMAAVVSVPPGLNDQGWVAALLEVGHRENVEIRVFTPPASSDGP
jgi:glycine cleavage system transcriptional repressor